MSNYNSQHFNSYRKSKIRGIFINCILLYIFVFYISATYFLCKVVFNIINNNHTEHETVCPYARIIAINSYSYYSKSYDSQANNVLYV